MLSQVVLSQKQHFIKYGFVGFNGGTDYGFHFSSVYTNFRSFNRIYSIWFKLKIVRARFPLIHYYTILEQVGD